MINLPEITSSSYIEYTFGILAIAEIAVALSMRFVRFKPTTVKKMLNRDFSELVRNFFTTEIITLALLDTVVIYGAVLFLLTGKLLFLQLFILLAVVCLLFFFPRLSRWTKAYENASSSLNE
jgi:ABC-type bacteriocin/lantibiotic exporter with double-glycine peptidase domain